MLSKPGPRPDSSTCQSHSDVDFTHSRLRRSGLIYRPIDRSEIERLKPLVVPDPASPLTAGQFQVRFESREYRPEWTWIAEEEPGDPAAAAAIWWGTATELMPSALDGLFALAQPGPRRRQQLRFRPGPPPRCSPPGTKRSPGRRCNVRLRSTCSCRPTGTTARMQRLLRPGESTLRSEPD